MSRLPSAKRLRGRSGSARAALLFSLLAWAMATVALLAALRPWHCRESRSRPVDWAQVAHLLAVYEERWDSEALVQARSQAASALLARTAADELEAILSFFDELGFLLSRQALDAELLWYHFYWPASCYLRAASRLSDASERVASYPYLSLLLTQLEEVQRRRTAPDKELPPTEREIDHFLADEAAPPSCEGSDEEDDQSEARMTPL